MFSSKSAVTVAAIATILAFSACSKKNNKSPAAAAPTDSAVSAEQQLNKSGCKFEAGPVYPTTGSEATTVLNCDSSKDSRTQIAAVADYTTKITATMKEKDRKDIGPLQVKLNTATAKLVAMEGDVDSPTEGSKSAKK